MACQMSFEGKGNREIASELGFTEATVSNWRKLELWQEFEAELIKAYKEQLYNAISLVLDTLNFRSIKNRQLHLCDRRFIVY